MQEELQLDGASVPVTDIYSNVDQVVIHITEDRLRLILGDYESRIGERRAWLAPLGVFVTILATLTTGTASSTDPLASVAPPGPAAPRVNRRPGSAGSSGA